MRNEGAEQTMMSPLSCPNIIKSEVVICKISKPKANIAVEHAQGDQFFSQHSSVHTRKSSDFPTRSVTNQAVQSQGLAADDLKFQIQNQDPGSDKQRC